jgi:beta-glucosidase
LATGIHRRLCTRLSKRLKLFLARPTHLNLLSRKKKTFMKKFIALTLSLSLAFVGLSQTKTADPIDQKVDSLLALMTLDEKIGQTNMYNGTWEFTGPVPENDYSQLKAENIKSGKVGGMLNVLTAEGTRAAQQLAVENSRLGIPLIFGYDVIHGYKTMLPVPLAQAASWDAEVAGAGAQVAAREAAAAGLHWTFAPMIDVSRDARWGRIMEGAGEDPYLTSVMAEAWVRGFQGTDLADPLTIAACAKHFAAYGFAEGGRDYNSVDISLQTLYNVVLPPFKAASDAGAATFMNSFNTIAGVPANGSSLLQREILKGRWNFEGFVVSDWGSINEMITHGYSPDRKTAAVDALSAGSDMDMESRIYETDGAAAIEEGLVDELLLDDAVRRILKIKYQLGLFDDPYRYSDEQREKAHTLTKENMSVARDAARKSIVLLKNEGGILPLDVNTKSIAVIGQLANSKDIPLGNWRGQAVANSAVSLLEGVKDAAKGKVKFELGYELTTGTRDFIHELTFAEDDQSGFEGAIKLAESSDAVILAMGEDCFQTGEGRSQADVRLKGTQEKLLAEIIKVNPNVVVVLMTGRPVAIPELMDTAPAVLEAWFGGSQAGNAIADVLFGAYNPSGKLPVSFPHHTGQEPLHYDIKNTGRPVTNEWDAGLVFWSHYTDMTNEALIPFGFGLSYTEFEYADLSVTVKEGGADVSITVSNTGARKGKETVQCYIRDVFAREVQPIKRLVDFEQVEMEAGESVTVKFELSEEELGYYHTPDGKFYAEDGLFHIMIGGNSVDLLKEEVEIKF